MTPREGGGGNDQIQREAGDGSRAVEDEDERDERKL
jgi:hypothetical protein